MTTELEIKKNIAKEHFRKKEYAEALKLYLSCLVGPDFTTEWNVSIFGNLALCYFQLESYEASLKYFQICLQRCVEKDYFKYIQKNIIALSVSGEADSLMEFFVVLEEKPRFQLSEEQKLQLKKKKAAYVVKMKKKNIKFLNQIRSLVIPRLQRKSFSKNSLLHQFRQDTEFRKLVPETSNSFEDLLKNEKYENFLLNKMNEVRKLHRKGVENILVSAEEEGKEVSKEEERFVYENSLVEAFCLALKNNKKTIKKKKNNFIVAENLLKDNSRDFFLLLREELENYSGLIDVIKRENDFLVLEDLRIEIIKNHLDNTKLMNEVFICRNLNKIVANLVSAEKYFVYICYEENSKKNQLNKNMKHDSLLISSNQFLKQTFTELDGNFLLLFFYAN
eukprot:snap_masked-scaffold_54-processed-gene-1.37-mRNA-1 protein AED:1.00 eAED:1.00 QI:0/-1/0/0/-1/1/1/0/391